MYMQSIFNDDDDDGIEEIRMPRIFDNILTMLEMMVNFLKMPKTFIQTSLIAEIM